MNDPFFSNISRSRPSSTKKHIKSPGEKEVSKKSQKSVLKENHHSSSNNNRSISRKPPSLVTITKEPQALVSHKRPNDSHSDYEDNDTDVDLVTRSRLKKAKSHIESLMEEKDHEDQFYDEIDAIEIDKELIADRLKNEALSIKGKLFIRIADKLKEAKPLIKTLFHWKVKQATVTAIAISDKGDRLYCACKDGIIQEWSLVEGNKMRKFILSDDKAQIIERPHNKKRSMATFYTLAVSSNGKFLAAGGKDFLIHIWDLENGKYIKGLKHHRSIITGLTFRKTETESVLYSTSYDRTVKVWNIDDLVYIDTLYGHYDVISNIDALSRERCVTSGNRDRSVRMWKVSESSQLVFNLDATEEGSLETVMLMDEEHFVSGSDTGAIAIWHIGKKKPMGIMKMAHGEGNGIVSLASLRYTDIFASGSMDGVVRVWKAASDFRSISSLYSIEIAGFINGLAFTNTAKLDEIRLAIAAGKEPRLGRWDTHKQAKNVVVLVSFCNG